MIDTYSELSGDAMDSKDGSTFHSVRTKGEWGIADGHDDKGAFLRVFDIDPDEKKGITSKSLSQAGKLDEVSGNSYDVRLPGGMDGAQMADGLLDRISRHSVSSERDINFQANQTLLTQFGFEDFEARHSAERRTYAETLKAVEKHFGDGGPHAFSEKPSKQIASLTYLKEDLGANYATRLDTKKPDASAPKTSPFTTVIPNLGRRPGA